MFETLFQNSAIWVHIAATLYVIGFCARDQLALRSFVLLGIVFYIVYYFNVAETPLWSAIIWSTTLGVVNLYVTIQLALERTTFRMSRNERQLYGAFASMTPGEFRKLIEKATWHDAEQPMLLTMEDTPNKSIFYIVEGSVSLRKKGRSFTMIAGTFIGEVSYLLESNATATAHAGKKTRFIEWRHDDLAEIERRYPSIRVALREMLNSDLAAKVADGAGGRCSCEADDDLKPRVSRPFKQGEAICV